MTVYELRVPPRTLMLIRDAYITILIHLMTSCASDIDKIEIERSPEGVEILRLETRSDQCLNDKIKNLNPALSTFREFTDITKMIAQRIERDRHGARFRVLLGSETFDIGARGKKKIHFLVKDWLDVIKLSYARDWRILGERFEREARGTVRVEAGLLDVTPDRRLAYTLNAIHTLRSMEGHTTLLLFSSLPRSFNELSAYAAVYSSLFHFRRRAIEVKEDASKVLASRLTSIAPDLAACFVLMKMGITLLELRKQGSAVPGDLTLSLYSLSGRLLTIHETVTLSDAESSLESLSILAGDRNVEELMGRISVWIRSLALALDAAGSEIPNALQRAISLTRLAISNALIGIYPTQELYELSRLCTEIEGVREEWAHRLLSGLCRALPL